MKNPTLLIVDDDKDIRSELAAFLQRYGINTVEATNAAQAKKILAAPSFNIDLVTVDVVMPGEDGLALTRWIVANRGLPTILLTSLDMSSDKIAGLEVGADDYVAKPFDPRELLARIRAVLRRYQIVSEDSETVDDGCSTEVGSWEYDEERGILTNAVTGKVILTSRENQVFRILLSHHGEQCSKEMITREIYCREWTSFDRTVDNILSKIRRKIELNPNEPEFIITSRHKGYYLSNRFRIKKFEKEHS